MPASITGKTQNWFTPNEFLSESVTADTNIDVERITAVFFTDALGVAIDVNVKIGSSTVTFPLPAGRALGIDDETLIIQSDVDGYLHGMGGR